MSSKNNLKSSSINRMQWNRIINHKIIYSWCKQSNYFIINCINKVAQNQNHRILVYLLDADGYNPQALQLQNTILPNNPIANNGILANSLNINDLVINENINNCNNCHNLNISQMTILFYWNINNLEISSIYKIHWNLIINYNIIKKTFDNDLNGFKNNINKKNYFALNIQISFYLF